LAELSVIFPLLCDAVEAALEWAMSEAADRLDAPTAESSGGGIRAECVR
jgi:hypothetical protein